VDRAIAAMTSLTSTRTWPLRVLDVGAGTGAVGLAILKQCPQARCSAIDIDPTAVSLARHNASLLGLTDRYECDVVGVTEYAERFARVGAVASTPFDMIVSNPPYIPDTAGPSLAPEVILHEPSAALFGGVDGLAIIREIVGTVDVLLAPHCPLLLEIDDSHQRSVENLVRESLPGRSVRIERDFAGQVRYAIIQ
jgi:release factor glutamine methyltransferase